MYTYIRVKENPTPKGDTKMIKQIREEVKKAIIAQNGKLYNFNLNNIQKIYGCDAVDLQNAVNYFRLSPQQKKFRETYNFH